MLSHGRSLNDLSWHVANNSFKDLVLRVKLQCGIARPGCIRSRMITAAIEVDLTIFRPEAKGIGVLTNVLDVTISDSTALGALKSYPASKHNTTKPSPVQG